MNRQKRILNEIVLIAGVSILLAAGEPEPWAHLLILVAVTAVYVLLGWRLSPARNADDRRVLLWLVPPLLLAILALVGRIYTAFGPILVYFETARLRSECTEPSHPVRWPHLLRASIPALLIIAILAAFQVFAGRLISQVVLWHINHAQL